VTRVYPLILYSFSDVVVFVIKNGRYFLPCCFGYFNHHLSPQTLEASWDFQASLVLIVIDIVEAFPQDYTCLPNQFL